MNRFLSSKPLWQNAGIFFIRIIVAIFLIIHGKEVFDGMKMQEYTTWDGFKSSTWMPYLGKGIEFFAGVLLLLGLFTRVACVLIIGTFLYITFFVGNGKFWMDDQHPFLFVLLALVFMFTGPGAWSMDEAINRNR